MQSQEKELGMGLLIVTHGLGRDEGEGHSRDTN